MVCNHREIGCSASGEQRDEPKWDVAQVLRHAPSPSPFGVPFANLEGGMLHISKN